MLQSSVLIEGDYVFDFFVLLFIEFKQELFKYLLVLQGCWSVEEFQCLNRIEEGIYGVVYRVKDKKIDEIVVLKWLKMEKEKEGFLIMLLREINIIFKVQYFNIVIVREIVVGSNMDKIYIVMNYVEYDFKSLMEIMKQFFLLGEVKILMIQLLCGVKYLYDNWILYCDFKMFNLLLSYVGIFKVGDFGLVWEYGFFLKVYILVVVILWYCVLELLFGVKEYFMVVDMWLVGCIFGELLIQKFLFFGKLEIDQINKVFKDLGIFSEKIWFGYSEFLVVKKMIFSEYFYNNFCKCFGVLFLDQGFDFMNKFLIYFFGRRISVEDGFKYEYFCEIFFFIDFFMFFMWFVKSEQQCVKWGISLRFFEGGLGYSQLGDDDLKEMGFYFIIMNQGVFVVGFGFSFKF